MSLQHYELFVDTMVKNLSKLLTWMESIRPLKDTHTGLGSVTSVTDPGNWDLVDEVVVEALTVDDLPTNTPWVITTIAWASGYDPSIKEHGSHRVSAAFNHPHVFGTHDGASP